jgi:pimeloyl-ACP methyl ester carboxylesterase
MNLSHAYAFAAAAIVGSGISNVSAFSTLKPTSPSIRLHNNVIAFSTSTSLHSVAVKEHDLLETNNADEEMKQLNKQTIDNGDANVNGYASTTTGLPKHNNRLSGSDMKRFVSEMRSLYNDLENGGGSVRRNMAFISSSSTQQSSAISFTYVAPSTSTTPKENAQLDGDWRLQTPIVYEVNADWSDIHRQIADVRMEQSLSSKPLPLLLYLPGLDGFGISATSQFDELSSTFELWRMTIDKSNVQLSFADLVSSVVKFVKDATNSYVNSPREVILVGESFGGLLSCAVAMALSNVASKPNATMSLKGMVLVNPATSFDETNWGQSITLLTSLRYLETQEEMIDDIGNFKLNNLTRLPTPYSVLGGLVLSATIPDRKQYSNIFQFIVSNVMTGSSEDMLAASSDGFRILAEYLPALTLEHRVTKWLPVGTSVVNNPQRLSMLSVPTLVVAGNDDNMLPTKEEANRLGKSLPDCVKLDVSGSGHFVLDSVNLTEVLLDSHIDPLDMKKTSKPYDPITDWTLPPKEVTKAVIQKRVKPQRERTSPVFFSTDSVTGKRRKGLSLVPSNSDKPLLFVGNHQLFGQDLGLIISQLIEERGIAARGLMHPIAAEGFAAIRPGEPVVRTQKRKFEFIEDNPAETDLFSMFGAVKVTPKNFYRLLQTNQAVLLFPGGVKEALHGKGEDYEVFWPDKKTDFVRVAARFNATIVPISAIGAADSVDIVLDAKELLDLPFGIGDNLKNFNANATSARYDTQDGEELFVPPLAVPKPFPARHYFLFGRAFDTSSIDPQNKDACQTMYEEIENELRSDIDALLAARERDPFALDGGKRAWYQRLFGKDPPTFPVESLPPSKV